MKGSKVYFLIILMACMGLSPASYANNHHSIPHKLRVGMMPDAAPFSYINKQGKPAGLAVDMWHNIATKAHLQYEIIPFKTGYDHTVTLVSQKKFDLFIGPISVTHDRLKRANYTRPFFIDRIGLAVKVRRVSFWHVLAATFGEALLMMMAVFLGLLVIFSHLFWWFERGKNKQVSKRYDKGILEAFWSTTSSFLRDVLYNPTTQSARITLGVWLILSVIFMSMITAVVTASLTHSIGKNAVEFDQPSDIMDHKIAAMEGSSVFASILHQYNATRVPTSGPVESLKMVMEDKADAAMGNFFTLMYAMKHHIDHHDTLRMSRVNLTNDELAFPIRKDLPALLEKIDLALSALQDSKLASTICERNLGIKYRAYCQM